MSDAMTFEVASNPKPSITSALEFSLSPWERAGVRDGYNQAPPHAKPSTIKKQNKKQQTKGTT
jgi:hypothetical protein